MEYLKVTDKPSEIGYYSGIVVRPLLFTSEYRFPHLNAYTTGQHLCFLPTLHGPPLGQTVRSHWSQTRAAHRSAGRRPFQLTVRSLHVPMVRRDLSITGRCPFGQRRRRPDGDRRNHGRDEPGGRVSVDGSELEFWVYCGAYDWVRLFSFTYPLPK